MNCESDELVLGPVLNFLLLLQVFRSGFPVNLYAHVIFITPSTAIDGYLII